MVFWLVARMIPLLGQDAEHGALPILYAGIPGNSFAGSSHLAHMRGAPNSSAAPPPPRDPDQARRLWTVSEQLTGVPSPV